LFTYISNDSFQQLLVFRPGRLLMCGGLAFCVDDISEEELERFFLPEELDAFRKVGHGESFFWSRRPVLPFKMTRTSNEIHLIGWGNREKEVNLPETGWAKWESFQDGKWKHLHPTKVLIPAMRGCEKKIWFDISNPIAAILAERDGEKRAYMITEPASEEYKELTGHDRMPKFKIEV